MTRPLLPAVVALAFSGCLLLTACGGSTHDASSATTTGPATPTVTPVGTPTQAANASAEMPTIQLPSGAENVFEGQHTGDPTKDAILFDNQQWVNSLDEAIMKQSENEPAIGFYSTDKALEASATYVHGYIKDGFTWVGVTRFFDRKLTLAADGSANLIYCSDESKANDKDKTGKVDYSDTEPLQDYVLYNTKLVKNKLGIWQTTAVVADRGSKQCTP